MPILTVLIASLLLISVPQLRQPADPLTPEPALTLAQPSVSLSAHWNGDGTRLLTSGRPGRCLITQSPPAGQTLAEFCPQGETQARHTIRVWDTDPASPTLGSVLLELDPEGTPEGVAWNAQETRIVAYSGARVFVWNAQTGVQEAALTLEGDVLGVYWSPDGERLLTFNVTAHPDQLVADIWQGETPAARRMYLPLGDHAPHRLRAAWSADGSRILIISDNGSAYLWQAADMRLLYQVPLGSATDTPSPHRLTWSADLAHLWLVDDLAGQVIRWTFADEAGSFTWLEGGEGLSLSADESQLVVWNLDSLTVRDAMTLALQTRWEIAGELIPRAEWSPLAGQVVIVTYDLGVQVWQPDVRSTQTLGCGDLDCGLPAWDPAQSIYAAAVYEPESGWFMGVQVFSQADGALLADLSAQVMARAAAQDGASYGWSPDGRWLLVYPLLSESLLLWDAASFRS